MTRTAVTPAQLAETQIEDAALAMGRAFLDEPFIRYVLPEEAGRQQLLPIFFRILVRAGYLYGETYSTDDASGVAFWARPGDPLTPERMAAAGMTALPSIFGDEAFARFTSVVDVLDALHERDVPEAHWYLALLGVDTPLQGRGIGSALLQPVLSKADADGVVCYTETEQPRNVPFYRRHGFEVLVDMIEPTSDVRLWTFRRERGGSGMGAVIAPTLIKESQVEPLGEALGRAFFESPLHKYFIPDDAERRRFLPQFLLRVVRLGYLFGETYATPDSTGMAFWIRPGEILGDEQNEHAGLNEIPALAGEEAFARVSIVFDALEGLHKEHATDDHWYLQLLGVDVPLQGQGRGSALMQPVLEKADADGVACHTDTANPKNVPFYRRHGFEVVVDMIEPSSGLHLWFFRREPRR